MTCEKILTCYNQNLVAALQPASRGCQLKITLQNLNHFGVDFSFRSPKITQNFARQCEIQKFLGTNKV